MSTATVNTGGTTAVTPATSDSDGGGTADALTSVEMTVAAMMCNSTGMATMTSDSGIMGDNNRQQQQ